MSRLRTGVLCTLLMTCAVPGTLCVGPTAQAPAGIVVRLAESVAKEPLDGRLLLLLSKDEAREPRFQVSATSLSSAQVFGVDVEGLKAGDEQSFDAAVLGYPLESLGELPPGEYTVQALLHKYETFRLSTGHTVKLPMDRGEVSSGKARPATFIARRRRFAGTAAVAARSVWSSTKPSRR